MSPRGGALKALGGVAWLVLLLSQTGCIRQAVLENDVLRADWKARTLSTAADPSLAQAALSAQLVELEALYQRAPEDARVLALLDHGYRLMARGFVELRRLEAMAAGDTARADQEAQLKADANARASYYRASLRGAQVSPSSKLWLESQLDEPEASCARHDRTRYEQRLNALLMETERKPEQRLERALLRRLVSAWLMPNVAARCQF